MEFTENPKFTQRKFKRKDTGEVITGMVTRSRIDRSLTPMNHFTYDIRHSDYNNKPATIEKGIVIVNFYRSIVTDRPLEFTNPDDPYIEIVPIR